MSICCNGFCPPSRGKGKSGSNKNIKMINHGGMIEIISDGELDCRDPEVMGMLMQALVSGPTMHMHPMHQKNSAVGDFFEQTSEDIVEYREDPKQFEAQLNYSIRSRHFVHGADMIPGLVAGFTNFLEKNNLSLDTIKKIRFKDKVTGNIEYVIQSGSDISSEKSSKVFGEFVDTNGNIHYFYGRQTTNDHEFKVIDNNLPDKLLKGVDPVISHPKISDKDITPLLEQPEGIRNKYMQKMKENEGYIRSTLLDSINLIFQNKFRTSGLIIGYQDLYIDKEKFNVVDLLNGSCNIEIETSPDLREMKGGWGHKINFTLNQKDMGKTASGHVLLWSTKKCV